VHQSRGSPGTCSWVASLGMADAVGDQPVAVTELAAFCGCSQPTATSSWASPWCPRSSAGGPGRAAGASLGGEPVRAV